MNTPIVTNREHNNRQEAMVPVLESKNKMQDLVDYLRTESRRTRDPQGRALFETGAEVVLGLKKAFTHYAAAEEEAWTSPEIVTTESMNSEESASREDEGGHAIDDEYNTHEASFRRHYQLNYRELDRVFKFYEPAYELGYKLAVDNPGMEWSVASAKAQSHWQTAHSSDWTDIADAVYYGWREQREPESLRVDH